MPKKEIIRYKGTVYNLNVEENHSYTANGFAVHNCIYIVAYNKIGPIAITWGKHQQMTWAFYFKYCDEAYAVIDNRDYWLKNDPIDCNKLSSYLEGILNMDA